MAPDCQCFFVAPGRLVVVILSPGEPGNSPEDFRLRAIMAFSVESAGRPGVGFTEVAMDMPEGQHRCDDALCRLGIIVLTRLQQPAKRRADVVVLDLNPLCPGMGRGAGNPMFRFLSQRKAPGRVTSSDSGFVTAGHELLDPELTDRPEHAEASFVVPLLDPLDQAVLDQRREADQGGRHRRCR